MYGVLCEKHGTPRIAKIRVRHGKECLESRCTLCNKERSNAYYYANPERTAEQRKKYLKSNKEGYKTVRNTQLMLNYGITLEDFNSLFEEQKGCCAICEKHQSEFKNALCVDHCHSTKKVRGLLCSRCNTAIGNLKDDPNTADKAAAYLRKSK
jgi:Recombination endonuclease VII